MAREKNSLKIALIILTSLVFPVVIAFNILAATDAGKSIYENSTSDVANALYQEITPAGWTFTIWGFIYIWQGLWLIYSLTTICRRKAGKQLYLQPIFPSILFLSFIINNACNVGWLFAWGSFKIALALPLLILTAVTLFIGLFVSLKRTYDNLDYINKNGLTLDLWLNRILIQNGIAFYAAWATVATIPNLGACLTYKDGSDLKDIGVPQDVSGTICLSILAFEVVVWFFLDIFFLDNYVRYLFSPYITLTVALAGIVSEMSTLDDVKRNFTFSISLLAVVAVCLVVKVTVMSVRHFRGSIVPGKAESEPTV